MGYGKIRTRHSSTGISHEGHFPITHSLVTEWLCSVCVQSVGEVMSIGRNFEEALSKAIRMVDGGNKGFQPKPGQYPRDEKGTKALDDEIRRPTPQRIHALAEAIDRGYTVEKLAEMTKIDPWWLVKLENIHSTPLLP